MRTYTCTLHSINFFIWRQYALYKCLIQCSTVQQAKDTEYAFLFKLQVITVKIFFNDNTQIIPSIKWKDWCGAWIEWFCNLSPALSGQINHKSHCKIPDDDSSISHISYSINKDKNYKTPILTPNKRLQFETIITILREINRFQFVSLIS